MENRDDHPKIQHTVSHEPASLDYVVFGTKTPKMCLVSSVAKFGLIRSVIAPEASHLI